MRQVFMRLLLACISVSAAACLVQVSLAEADRETPGTSTESPNPVVQWNRTLLVIVRTPGAQPATIHPTRSFAMMHAAIYDAVNAIDRTHKPYLVSPNGVPRSASQEAAAASAAHDVLVALYPNFQSMLDDQLQQSLAPIPDGADKAEGLSIGRTVAAQILAIRKNDGSDAQPIPFVFGNAPGDYQSTRPIFPSNRNSLTGPMSPRLPWNAPTSFGPEVLPR